MVELSTSEINIESRLKRAIVKTGKNTITVCNSRWYVDSNQIYLTIAGISYLIDPDKLINAVNKVRRY